MFESSSFLILILKDCCLFSNGCCCWTLGINKLYLILTYQFGAVYRKLLRSATKEQVPLCGSKFRDEAVTACVKVQAALKW